MFWLGDEIFARRIVSPDKVSPDKVCIILRGSNPWFFFGILKAGDDLCRKLIFFFPIQILAHNLDYLLEDNRDMFSKHVYYDPLCCCVR